MFDETADLLIDQHKGDIKLALKIALAYGSGFYKAPTKSQLTNREGFGTIQMNV